MELSEAIATKVVVGGGSNEWCRGEEGVWVVSLAGGGLRGLEKVLKAAAEAVEN